MDSDEEGLNGIAVLARHVTVYRQWSFVRRWAGDPRLREPGVQWFLHNDAPDDPCPSDLRETLTQMGVDVSEGRFNLGRSSARNALARRSSAPFIEFIDGDDIPLPIGRMAKQLKGADLFSFPIRTYRIEGTEMKEGPVEINPGFDCPGLFTRLSKVSPLPASLIYSRHLFNECGGFDGRFDTIEDLHLLWKFDQAGAVVSFAETPKQFYFLTNMAGRCDGDIRPLHWIRFFRHACALAEKQGTDSAAIRRFVETSELNAVQALLDDLEALLPRDRAHLSALPGELGTILKELETESQSLSWKATRLFIRSARPHLFRRLREAVKLLMGRAAG